MLKILKSRKALLVAALVAIFGWVGIQLNEQDVTKAVDTVIQQAESVQTELQQQEPAQQPAESSPSPTQEETEKPTPQPTQDFNSASHISDSRRVHILHGDATGGGHLYGTGKPCKSEFPKHWSEDTVIKEVELIAANDNLNWEQQRNGYFVTEQNVGTVRVRVVKARNGEDVITAYPTNVKRNYCPANDR